MVETLNRKGSILLHTLVVVTLMAWVASMLLQWGMGRYISTKETAESNEDKALLDALQAISYSCLTANNTDCPASAQMLPKGPCLPPDAAGRAYNAQICPGNPACRVQISLCPKGQASCAVPSC